jgi:hypothetical protein
MTHIPPDQNPAHSPPEVPVTPGPGPEIQPGYRPEPEIPALPPDTFDPGAPSGPEVVPDTSPEEIPVPGEAAAG